MKQPVDLCCGSLPDVSQKSPFVSLGAEDKNDTSCCCSGQYDSIKQGQKPGCVLCDFVEGFLNTPVGRVPRVKTQLERSDIFGTIRARLGVGRGGYRVSPGLYAVGFPDKRAPILVTANYKLSFDTLRKNLVGIEAWILVVDTKGINVWCSAGKGVFSAGQVACQVKELQLDQIVDHRRLILPQLSANGVNAQKVRESCGFSVVWGPIRASDLKAFLVAGCRASDRMRRVSFALSERLVLIPVELILVRKRIFWAALAALVISSVGSWGLSLSMAWTRGLWLVSGLVSGILTGAVIVPVLLPWIPSRAFALKGVWAGLVTGFMLISATDSLSGIGESFSVLLLVLSTASWTAMNFTGATPFTSPSGVEKEMRKAIPLQLTGVVAAAATWVTCAFIRA